MGAVVPGFGGIQGQAQILMIDGAKFGVWVMHQWGRKGQLSKVRVGRLDDLGFKRHRGLPASKKEH